MRTSQIQHCVIVAALFSAILGAPRVQAQTEPPPSPASASVDATQDDGFWKEAAAFSRPGKYHQLFAHLAGTWNYRVGFPDISNPTFRGIMVWRSFANGRFFVGEASGDESQLLEMPIQDGKSSPTIYRGLSLLGYDNVKKKFQLASIQNHFGSDIAYVQGDYEPTTRSVSFDSQDEVVPGRKTGVRQTFVFLDKDHYAIRNFEMKDGKYVQISETGYTRSAP